jgi:hypothetical protein
MAGHLKVINPYTILSEIPKGRDHVGHLNVTGVIRIEFNTEIE